jgi:cardiolipin synthase
VAGEPGREQAYRVLEYLAAGCGNRLWITDAYLVPPLDCSPSWSRRREKGADIRLLVPGTSDVPFVQPDSDWLPRPSASRDPDFRWEGPMLHAKSAVVDGTWCRVGSSNLNASSLLGNYELDVVINDAELATAMEAQFRKDLASSVEVERRQLPGSARLGRLAPSRLTRQTTGERRLVPIGPGGISVDALRSPLIP